MGNGHRATAPNLFLKLRYDASGAAQNVAKSDDDHRGVSGTLLQPLANYFGQTLRCTHYVGRSDCLVSGPKYKTLNRMPYCRAGDDMGTDDIVEHCLPRIVFFHQQYVLVCGRVKDDRWACVAQYLIHARNILYVDYKRKKRHVGKCLEEFLL